MNRRFNLGDHRSFIAGYSFAPVKSKIWILYLPESGSGFIQGTRKDLAEIVGSKLASHFNFLVINKAGLSANLTNAKTFETSFRRLYRLEDAKVAADYLIPKDHSIDIVGYSEGAYLAPQLAGLLAQTRSVVMMGGGTRGWLKEELSNAGPRQRSALAKQIREILNHPRSQKKWNGFSYATWHSYKDDHTLRALKKLKLPTLAIIGARDKTIDFKSAHRDLKSLAQQKNQFKTKVFAQCGHSFVNHWADARFEIQKFLQSL